MAVPPWFTLANFVSSSELSNGCEQLLACAAVHMLHMHNQTYVRLSYWSPVKNTAWLYLFLFTYLKILLFLKFFFLPVLSNSIYYHNYDLNALFAIQIWFA